MGIMEKKMETTIEIIVLVRNYIIGMIFATNGA